MDSKNVLELQIISDGSLHDKYTNLIIKKIDDMPTNILLINIDNYNEFKKYLDASIIEILKVENDQGYLRYRLYYDSIDYSCFINENCDYDIYLFLHGNKFFVKYNPFKMDVDEYFTLDDMITEGNKSYGLITLPCIVEDARGFNEDIIIMENNMMHEHFSLKPLLYHDNVREKYEIKYYIMDVKSNVKNNFITKKATKH